MIISVLFLCGLPRGMTARQVELTVMLESLNLLFIFIKFYIIMVENRSYSIDPNLLGDDT